jgi:hydroxymethylbilane synthase
MDLIRIGTRRSMLAMAQSRLVAEALRQQCGVEAELVGIVTRGDRRTGPLAAVGGKGLFTAELEAALRRGDIHLAVHSAKDVPATMSDDLVISAVPRRADARDALVSRGGVGLGDLRPGASVGTGSLRRSAQIRTARGDLNVVPIRGNVETRLRKALMDGMGGLDAVVVALAGLERSGLAGQHVGQVRPLELEQCVPAAGQGALVVQTTAAAKEVQTLVAAIDDPHSRQALLAERAVLAGLGADCRACVAVHVAPEGGHWRGCGMVARPDGADMVRLQVIAATAQEVGRALCDGLRRKAPSDLFLG